MSTDAERRRLYDALVTNLGPNAADTLMAGLVYPTDRAGFAKQDDLLALRGDFAQLRGEFAELRGEVRALGSRLDAQLSKLVAANAVTAVAVAGLAFTAGRLAG